MQEGEAIESRSRQPAGSKGRRRSVEERHFEHAQEPAGIRRGDGRAAQAVYSFRQRILDGGDCREIHPRHDRQADQEQWSADHSWDRQYRWNRRASPKWAGHYAWASNSKRQGLHQESRTSRIGIEEQYFSSDEANNEGRRVDFARQDRRRPARRRRRPGGMELACSCRNGPTCRFGLNTNDRELKNDRPRGASTSTCPRRTSGPRGRSTGLISRPLQGVSGDEHFGTQDRCAAGLHHQFTLAIRRAIRQTWQKLTRRRFGT